MNQMCGAYEVQADCHHEANSMSASRGSPQARERLQGPAAEGRQPGAWAQTGVTTWGGRLQPQALASQGPHGGKPVAHYKSFG